MISLQQLAQIAAVVKGIPVLGCRPGSPAAELGIGYGDIVLAINGVATPTVVEYLAARRLRSDGFDVRLFRDGVERSVFVPFHPPTDVFEALGLQLAHASYVPSSSVPPKPLVS
jgi:S1-C subfamily serine protease